MLHSNSCCIFVKLVLKIFIISTFCTQPKHLSTTSINHRDRCPIETSMSIAIAQARHIFGINPTITGNVFYHDEQTIVYAVGAQCVLYNIDQKEQRFISGSEKSDGITAIAVSPNRRYVAIAEKGEKPTVTVYDLHSLRKKKVYRFCVILSIYIYIYIYIMQHFSLIYVVF